MNACLLCTSQLTVNPIHVFYLPLLVAARGWSLSTAFCFFLFFSSCLGCRQERGQSVPCPWVTHCEAPASSIRPPLHTPWPHTPARCGQSPLWAVSTVTPGVFVFGENIFSKAKISGWKGNFSIPKTTNNCPWHLLLRLFLERFPSCWPYLDLGDGK